MPTRRRFFSMMGATLAVGSGAHAQTKKKIAPKCLIISKTDTRWEVVSSVSNTFDFDRGEAPAEMEWYLTNRSKEAGFSGFDALDIDRTTYGTIRILPRDSGKIGARIDCPRLLMVATDGKVTSVRKDYLQGRETYLDFHFDGEDAPEARLPDVTTFREISVQQLNDRFTTRLKSARTLELRLVVRNVGMTRATFDVENLEHGLARGPVLTEEHRKKIEAAGECAPVTCMMTTAAVGMLGRADDCFELTQMRRLRAAYGHETDVLEAYLTASKRVLRRLPSWRVAARILLFYGVVVWPTAVLARLGALRAARAWYLGGFRRIMGRFAA